MLCLIVCNSCGHGQANIENAKVIDSVQSKPQVDLQSEVKKFENRIDDLEAKSSDNSFLYEVAIAVLGLLSLISLALVVLALRRYKEQQKDLYYLNEKIRSKTNGINDLIQGLNEKVKNLEQRVKKTEDWIAQRPSYVQRQQPAKPDVKTSLPSSMVSQSLKQGYAINPIGSSEDAYFEEIKDSRVYNANYRVYYLSETEAEFEPLSFRNIASSSTAEKAVECTGVQNIEASDMRILERGHLKWDGTKWNIMKRVKVELIK